MPTFLSCRPATLFFLLIAIGGCRRVPSIGTETDASTSAALAPSVASQPVDASAKPSTLETGAAKIMSRATMQDAFAFAKPQMDDQFAEVSDGTVLFATWSARKLAWLDVNVLKDETSPALARKDIDDARGKRMCFTGKLVQIAKLQAGDAKMFSGLLMTRAGSDLLHFLAVGSTSALVAGDEGRYCGVVTGLYDYKNSGGGTGHAIQMVGMFDLPENKPDAGKK